MPCCAEEPRGGFPLTLTKDIMVNAKVLHLQSCSFSQDFLSGRLEKNKCTLLCCRFVSELIFVSNYAVKTFYSSYILILADASIHFNVFLVGMSLYINWQELTNL